MTAYPAILSFNIHGLGWLCVTAAELWGVT